MKQSLVEQIPSLISGEVYSQEGVRAKYRHDASIFSLTPELVVFPKNEQDVVNLVKFVSEHKKHNLDLSLTARAAGTCMSGGGLTDSILLEFTKYFNHKPVIKGRLATVEPGLFYRDFESETLKHDLLYPAYPSSREICAMGGIIQNNAGGEKSLQYGKAEDYVEKMRMVMSDGSVVEFGKLSESELKQKMQLKTYEGEIYRRMFALIQEHYTQIMSAKPKVSKNSAGYYLWNIYDKEKKTFDLTKLLVGSQGTLGIMLEATLKLVPVKKHREMLVIDLFDLANLGEIINLILPAKPESLEMYDDNTLRLALKYYGSFGERLGTRSLIGTFRQFLPEFMLKLNHNLPKLVLQAEFVEDDFEAMHEKILKLEAKLEQYHPQMTVVKGEQKEKKYWLIRRESFNLLRNRVKNKYSSPFIDDFIVEPKYLVEFLPKLQQIFAKYPSLIYTIAGHAGNGNFHIIPLMDLNKKAEREIIPRLSKEVFELVAKYGGSTSGEHNDGLIRTPYLETMFSPEIIKLFEQTKEIFDPQGIFNPRKKVHGDLDFAMKHIRTKW